MRQLTFLVVVVSVLAACNKTADPTAEPEKEKAPSYGAGDPRNKEQAEAAEAAAKAPPVDEASASFGGGGGTPDFSGKKLVAADGVVDDLKFTLKIPEGLPRDPKAKGDWDDGDTNHDHFPKVFTQTFEIRRIKSVDEAKYYGTLDSRNRTWTRAKETGASIELTMAEPDKSRIEAIVYKKATDDLYIRCKAVQASEGDPLPSYDKTKQMLEAICDSIQVKK